MVITAEHRFADYIPLHISEMERIVDQTYDKTRGKPQAVSIAFSAMSTANLRLNSLLVLLSSLLTKEEKKKDLNGANFSVL